MTDALDNLLPALRAVAPHGNVVFWEPLLAVAMRAAEINTPRRAAAFLGQCSEESGAFTALSENLNYSAVRMMQVWPARFPNLAAALPYANNPEALANNVYGARMGNVEAGDGWRYRGGGLLQVTGRANYNALARALKMSIEDAAGFVRTPEGAVRSATWVWGAMNLNPLADAWRLTDMTRTLNGGLNNLAARIQLCNAALNAFEQASGSNAAPIPPPLSPSVVVPVPPATIEYHTDPAVLSRLAALERQISALISWVVPGAPTPAADPDNSADDLNQAELDRIHSQADAAS